MTQSELNRSVAQATGETPATISSRGFSLISSDQDESHDPDEEQSFCLDCPGCGAQVVLSEQGLVNLPELAECHGCDAAYPYEYAEIYSPNDSPFALAVCA